jgi:PqqD family protein of HPr-rel-A system
VSASNGIRWRAEGPNRFLWHFFEEQWAVFDTVSGDTHLLNLLAGEALQLLQREEMDLMQLSHNLSNLFDLEINESFVSQIGQLLDEFNELGLIESAGA